MAGDTVPVSTSTRRSVLVTESARCVVDAFEDYNASFSDITRRGKRRFEHADRTGMRTDVVARINLYDEVVDEAISRLEQLLSNRLFSRSLWKDIHVAYAGLIEGRIDVELYKTFFNTITRRLFKTRGVDSAIEFVAFDFEPEAHFDRVVARREYSLQPGPAAAFGRILSDFEFSVAYRDAARDATRLARRVEQVRDRVGIGMVESIEIVDTVFYREGRAYLVGRVMGTDGWFPCVMALTQRAGRIEVDAVLTRRRQLSILFGFTFSYFLADLPAVGASVAYLRLLLPEKPVDELYTVLGRAKQGKTERYRAFFRHMRDHPSELLVEADGQQGMVMLVFTLPDYALVFKLIRDRFAPAKKFGRHRVIERYRLVYRHDRVGRLLDVQEFKGLRFERNRFDPELLAQLETDCQRSVRIEQQSIVIRHCYVERRLRPLDLYLTEVNDEAAGEAVIDYGQAIKDLARSNIFAGDLLPKNFGVTRSGRVIFYDYDELRLMTECRFRSLPQSDDDMLELHDEPWFNVEDNDVFPEQFPRFMHLGPDHIRLLRAVHGELFDPAWWQGIQCRLASGEALDVPPYGADALLPPDG